MPRPTGFWINREAWEDVTRLAGLSIPTVAERGDIKATTLRTVVSGNDRASLELAHKIARAIDVRVETLFPSISHRFEQNNVRAAA